VQPQRGQSRIREVTRFPLQVGAFSEEVILTPRVRLCVAAHIGERVPRREMEKSHLLKLKQLLRERQSFFQHSDGSVLPLST
jgi:hypothetical protein